MRNKNLKKLFSYILSGLLITAIAFTSGCSDNEKELLNNPGSNEETPIDIGEGETEFTFIVVDGEDNQYEYEVHTNQSVVGDALLELELIDGDDSEYGLFVKSVNGITADFDTDGTYWAFYIDGEYANSGVDETTITEGSTYSFKVEK